MICRPKLSTPVRAWLSKRRRDHRGTALLVALSVLTLAGCAGPARPLSVGVQSVYSNVILGNQDQPPPPPPAAAVNLNPGFPLPIQPPLPTQSPLSIQPPLPMPSYQPPVSTPTTLGSFTPPPSSLALAAPTPSTTTRPPVRAAPPPVCPPTDPNLPVSRPPTLVVGAPPVNGTYPFRVIGTYTLTGAHPRTTTYPEFTTRVVKRLPDDASGNYWNYSETQSEAGSGQLVTTYFSIEHTQTFVTAHNGVGPVPENGDVSGIYLTGIDLKRADGSTDSFRPEPALELLETPAAAGEGGSESGTDPLSQTTMSLNWFNEGMIPVAACGKVVGAWEVKITNGQVVGNSSDPRVDAKNLTFSGDYFFATEDGGIDVGDGLIAQGTDGGAGVKIDTQSYIDVLPKQPS